MTALRHCLFIFFLGFLLASCSSTKMVDSWSDQSHAGEVKSIFIIGFVNAGSDRMLYENIFSARLAEEGIDSQPSHSYALRYDEVEREAILDKIRSSGCDAVLLTRVVDQRTRAFFADKNRTAVVYSQKPLNGKEIDYSVYPIDSVRRNAKSSGILVTPKSKQGTSFVVLTVESFLYDPKTEQLIWSSTMETNLARNKQKMMQKLTEETVKSLKADGLI